MNKVIQFFLILLLIVAPLGLLTRIQVASNVHIVPQDIIVGIIAFLTAYYFFSNKRLPRRKTLLIGLFAFVCIGLISSVINSFTISNYNVFVACMYTVRYMMYGSLLFINEIIGVGYKKWVWMSGAFIVFAGIPQYFFYNNLANLSYLGWDIHLYRLFSTFLDPNFAGAFFVIFFFYLIPFLWESVKVRSKLKILLFSGLELLALFSIFFTYSRTSLIMLTIGLIIFFVLLKKIKLLVLSLVCIVVIILSISDFSVEGLNPFRIASSTERIRSAIDATLIFTLNPIIGIGFNGYRYAQVHYGFRSEIGAVTSNADAGTDNSYLFVLATTGVLGFAAFIYFYAQIINTIKKRSIEDIATYSLLMATLVGTLFLNILFYTPFLLWLYLMLGVVFPKVGK